MRTIGASGKTVIIDASVTGADTVNVWERGVSALSAASSVRFATANGSAEFESSVLTSGGDVSVSVGTAQPNAVQKRALGEKLDSAQLFLVSAAAGGRSINAQCSLGVPVKTGGCVAAAIADDGTITAS